jgi:uncharacterized protein
MAAPTLDPGSRVRGYVGRDVPGRGRARRWSVRAALAVLLVVAVAYAAAGWYVSDQIVGSLTVEPPRAIEYDTEVVAISGTQITLQRPDEAALEADRDAVMGLSWEGGYGQVGPASSFDGGAEERSFTLLDGVPPAVGTDVVDVDAFAFPTDPRRVGLDPEVVAYASPLGELEAWMFPGEGSTWLIAVHGVGADRHEFLRLIDATRDLAYPTLVIRYRNDPDSPATSDRLILVGQDEWPDLEAAVAHALAQGATDVVVYGASMGAGLALAYAMEGDADVLRGLVLESPNVDVRETVRLRAGEALPIGGPVGDSILAAGRLVTWLRTGLDFDATDYVDRAGELSVPVLVFHGTDDPKIPTEVVRSLADARPDLVEFHELEGGAHVRAWNEGPERYASTIGRFLERIGRER